MTVKRIAWFKNVPIQTNVQCTFQREMKLDDCYLQVFTFYVPLIPSFSSWTQFWNRGKQRNFCNQFSILYPSTDFRTYPILNECLGNIYGQVKPGKEQTQKGYRIMDQDTLSWPIKTTSNIIEPVKRTVPGRGGKSQNK